MALNADLEDLVSDSRGVRTLLQRRETAGSTVFGAKAGTGGLEPAAPFLDLPVNADLHAALLIPGGGTLGVYNTRGDGTTGNELRAVVDAAGIRTEQRLNAASTQASEMFDAIAVGPTGTLAVPFKASVTPYVAERPNGLMFAVRPAGAQAFGAPQPIFPGGAEGYNVSDGRTFLGPDGGGWIFLLPSGQDWRAGEPVTVLARRIRPDGQLGALLHLPVPIARPINSNVAVAAAFDDAGDLVAAFSGSAYEQDPADKDEVVERAAVWTQTFTPSTATVPERSMIVDRRGGYDSYDNVDLEFDQRGRGAVVAQTRGGLRVFRQRGAAWVPGPRLVTTRHTWSAKLVRLADGRTAATWLQPYNRSLDRSHLMVAAGQITASRWRADRVRGLGRPGLVRLDDLAAYGDDGIVAAVYARGIRLVFTQIAR